MFDYLRTHKPYDETNYFDVDCDDVPKTLTDVDDDDAQTTRTDSNYGDVLTTQIGQTNHTTDDPILCITSRYCKKEELRQADERDDT